MFRKGLTLAVPESAVIDTGTRKVVYVETAPGQFDGLEVVLGPRCGDKVTESRAWRNAERTQRRPPTPSYAQAAAAVR